MFLYHQACLWLAVASLAAAQESNLPACPFAVDIGNVTIGGNNRVARGMQMWVGTPPQPIAFAPRWPQNNTFIFGSSCFSPFGNEPVGPDKCNTFRGGQYDQFASSSRGDADSSSVPTDDGPKCDYATESLKLNDEVTMKDQVVGIVKSVSGGLGDQGYAPMNGVGLGPDSSILKALMEAKKIPSRTWSMFWGREGANSNTMLDGTFVFGGYDKAKVTGSPMRQSLDGGNRCVSKMLVSVTDLIVNFPNGTDVSLFDGVQSDAMAACLDPTYPGVMDMPLEPYFERFLQVTAGPTERTIFDMGRSFGIYFYNILYPNTTDVFAGDLTINIGSLAIRIPNDQLVIPHRTIDADGIIQANASEPNLAINSLQQINGKDLPRIGNRFFSAAYVMLNQDANEMTLWKANPTANQELVGIGPDGGDLPSRCRAPGGSESRAPSSSTDSPSPSPSSDGSSLSGGAIAGIVVGVIAGLAVPAAIAFVLFHRRKRNADAVAANPPAYSQNGEKYKYATAHAASPGAPMGELHSGEWRPQEMSANPEPRQPVELPSSRM